MPLIRYRAFTWLALLYAVSIMVGGQRMAVASPDVPLAYVANAGNNHIQVIDLISGQTLRKIYAGVAPWRLVLNPDRTQLWAQHWASETTTVIYLRDLSIAQVLPVRGPGTFTHDGTRFLSFNWPDSALHVIDGQMFSRLDTHITGVREVYDLVPAADYKSLYMVQYDPLAQGPRERFGYVMSYPFSPDAPQNALPKSYGTGPSPLQVVVPSQGTFVLSADSETNRLSLSNTQGDRRTAPTCLAPRRILLTPDETRMVVFCWAGHGERQSQMITYRVNFTTRLWPTITQEATASVDGGLVAGRFAPSGEQLYVVDQTHKRLYEVNPYDLRVRQSFATGDVPMDVEVVLIPLSVRDRLAMTESKARQALKGVLTRLQRLSRPFEDLSWTEMVSWTTHVTKAGTVASAAPQTKESSKRITYSLKGPNWVRSETEDGQIRIARGGTALSIDRHGRFWVTPRQDLVSMLYALPNLSVDMALRELTGDVPDSPFLRGGMAIDLITEVREGHHRFFVIGTSQPGTRVSQLWIDAETGYPTNLVEQFPVIQTRGHKPQGFGGIVETKFYDFALTQNQYLMPERLERVIDGKWTQQVRIEQVKVDRGLSDERFDLSRLGGMDPKPSRDLIDLVQIQPTTDQPGWTVPVLAQEALPHALATHTPYNSSPPTSGPHLAFPARWGEHTVPVPLGLQVHNLARGGVALQYNCPQACPDLVARLKKIVKRYDHLLLAPYPLMDVPIALTAWGKMMTLREFDEARIVAFIEAYAGQDHAQSEHQGYP